MLLRSKNVLVSKHMKITNCIKINLLPLNQKIKNENFKTKILVVEDYPINQTVARISLEKKGYQVDIAEDGNKALKLYQSKHYDAILMDMELPDMQGTEVTKIIREHENKEHIHTPIIALTSNGEEAKATCLQAGMDAFTTKPFNPDNLDKEIKLQISKSLD